jgi:hypothetical protein
VASVAEPPRGAHGVSVERFDVSEERARQDVDALLRDLVAAGALVEAAPGKVER